MVNRVFQEHIKAGLAPFREQLVCAYLFGSQARGDAKPASDVDIAILFRQDPPRSLDGLGLNIAGAIEAELGQQVDLVVLNRASPDLVHRVLRDSVLLLETDRGARVKFEHRARSEYFDVLPYLREYRRASGGSS
jgi:predicted nucleotidyltransferase